MHRLSAHLIELHRPRRDPIRIKDLVGRTGGGPPLLIHDPSSPPFVHLNDAMFLNSLGRFLL